jgi:ComF family protein
MTATNHLTIKKTIKAPKRGVPDTLNRSEHLYRGGYGHRVLQAALEPTIKIIKWLVPAVCVLCRQTHLSTEAICHDCDQRLPRNQAPCSRCALPCAGMTSTTTSNRCTHCQQHRFYFEQTHAPFLMQAGIRDLIHLWKFQHQPQLSPLLASLFISAMLPTPPSPSSLLLVPIPTQWRRQLHRGFDHTRVLAQAIAATYPHSLTVKPWLRHTRSGAPQHRLSRLARWRNQQERFVVNERVQGRRVVLLDDVMTTGATVNAAAGTCLEAGAKQVTVWCLARTPEPGSPLTRYHGGLCNGEAHHEPSLREPNARYRH